MTTLALQSCERRIRSWSLLLLAWVTGTVVLAATGSLATNDLLMPLLIIASVAAFALAYRANPGFRSAVLSLDGYRGSGHPAQLAHAGTWLCAAVCL
jgi:hypothetical protein